MVIIRIREKAESVLYNKIKMKMERGWDMSVRTVNGIQAAYRIKEKYKSPLYMIVLGSW